MTMSPPCVYMDRSGWMVAGYRLSRLHAVPWGSGDVACSATETARGGPTRRQVCRKAGQLDGDRRPHLRARARAVRGCGSAQAVQKALQSHGDGAASAALVQAVIDLARAEGSVASGWGATKETPRQSPSTAGGT